MSQLLFIVMLLVGYSTSDDLSNIKRRLSNLESLSKANVHFHPTNVSRIHTSSNPFLSQSTTYNFWKMASWTNNSVISKTYHLDQQSGFVTIKKPGTYLIYAQMVYHDLSARWSYGIHINDVCVQKCIATEQLTNLEKMHPTSHGVYQSCTTLKIHKINAHNTVSIKCLYGNREVLTSDEFTYWGIIALS